VPFPTPARRPLASPAGRLQVKPNSGSSSEISRNAATMQVETPSNAFEVMPGERLRSPRRSRARCVSQVKDNAVPPEGLNGFTGGARQSAG
jgi:hypothetical protein